MRLCHDCPRPMEANRPAASRCLRCTERERIACARRRAAKREAQRLKREAKAEARRARAPRPGPTLALIETGRGPRVVRVLDTGRRRRLDACGQRWWLALVHVHGERAPQWIAVERLGASEAASAAEVWA